MNGFVLSFLVFDQGFKSSKAPNSISCRTCEATAVTWHKAQHQQLPGFSLAAHGSRHSSFAQSPEFAGAPWPLAS